MSEIGTLISVDEEDQPKSRVVLDYTSRDFTAIRAQLVGLAKGLMPEWETAGEAPDFGTLILELFAYMGDVIHFYIDRTASEAFLGTAIRRQSVLYIADMLGYVPIGQQAAVVRLLVSLDSNAEAPITLPSGTRVHNETDDANNLIVFELAGDLTLTPGDVDVEAFADEGVTMNNEFLGIGQGIPSSEYLIQDKGVIFGSISVTSQEAGRTVNWSFTSLLSLARPNQSVFTTFTDDQMLTHVVFGDNASGRIPPVGANLYVTYRFGAGAAANLLPADSISVLVSPTNIDTFGVVVRNPESPLGGTDPESVESMRYSIPRAAGRIKSRAVTLNDYADLALQVPGIAKSIAHGTVYTAVYVRIAPIGGDATDTYMGELCDSVEAYMADKVIVGSTVYAEPTSVSALWQNVYIRMTVHVMEGYNRTLVRQAVDSTVRLVLAFDSVDFGTRISIGSMYRAALSVQGVEWVELNWLNTAEPVDTTEPGNPNPSAIAAAVWQHNATLTMADPGSRHYRRNNATNPTAFAFSATDDDLLTPNLALLQVGDFMIYRPVQDVASWMSFTVTAAPVNNTTWWQVAVSKVDQGATVIAPGNNDKVLFSIVRYDPSPDSLGGVVDIDTDELLIPRIAPQPPIKTSSITNVALTTNVATLTTGQPHNMLVGETIEVSGVTPIGFNGQYLIATVPTTTTLTYALTSADFASAPATGTVKTVNLPESDTDFPGMTTDERTHDGLWVIAEGGTVNT